jgi:hypothetical protein
MSLPRLLAIASIAFLVPIGGCSSGNPMAPAKVSGRISYGGKPLKAGNLKFHTTTGVPYDGQISPDGTYTAIDLPEGEAIITVETESINPNRNPMAGVRKTADNERRMKAMSTTRQQAPGGADAGGAASVSDASANYVKIPEKYNNPKTSPLSITLSKGRQVFNIELTD